MPVIGSCPDGAGQHSKHLQPARQVAISSALSEKDSGFDENRQLHLRCRFPFNL